MANANSAWGVEIGSFGIKALMPNDPISTPQALFALAINEVLCSCGIQGCNTPLWMQHTN